MQKLRTKLFVFPQACTAKAIVAAALAFCSLNNPLFAQRNRITGRIDDTHRAMLRGHLHPQAIADDDNGPVDPSLPLSHVTLMLKKSDSQQMDLDQLLAEQKDPGSANYHHWLTPEEYADRFGVSQDDVNKVVSWLQNQNLQVSAVGRGRNWIAFDGTAEQVGQAFHTEIHRYSVGGKMHFANAAEPSIPAALDGVVSRIHGLNDFRFRPPKRLARAVPQPGAPDTSQSNYTSATSGNHYLAPDDIATIYNISSLYNAGVNGTGQKIAVVGQTQINLSDIQQFRTRFNLPANDPQVILVPNSKDPGVITDDLVEADLDIEWAGAVARNAGIVYVYSQDVTDAMQYAIDQNLASVVSMSYGLCEALTAQSDALTLQSLAKQANSQGITWITASGDSGGADCVTSTSRNGGGLSVDVPASIPEVTGIGGTQFSEGTGTYWNATNGSNFSSVLSYIPEVVWNESAPGAPSASGGGASVYFSKPNWQVATGVPADGARDVPDISLAASADHDGYLIYSSGKQQVVGGTSVGAPAFAGVIALLNHYLISNGIQASAGLGNINPRLYSLAQTSPSVFHDVTGGNNTVTVTCSGRSRNCTAGSFGFDAGSGYDQATGLGSIDTYNLVTLWSIRGSSVTRGSTAMTLTSSADTIPAAGSVNLIATVTSANGGTPSGSVTFYLNGNSLGTATVKGSNATATATLSVSGSQLLSGRDTITAEYGGDLSYNGTSASVAITVTSQSGAPLIGGLTNGASFTQTFAPGMLMTVFGSQLAPSAQAASGVPLPVRLSGVSATINGIAAPLYYVSPGQLNIQVPYEVNPNTTAILSINNNGQTASRTFSVSAAAPGIFTDQTGTLVPNATAARGQVITMYVTGAGAVSPAIADGSAPGSGTALASLPKPFQTVAVTVGGRPAPVQFTGIPAGLVGVTQVNFQVPAAVLTGSQPVSITIGSTTSATASLNITQ